MRRDEMEEALITYQIARLRREYQDFTGTPKWAIVGEFFFERVYGTRDKKARDEAGRRLFTPARKILGDEIGTNLSKLLELNELTDRLDQDIVDKLFEMRVDTFSPEAYEEAYRLCDNYRERHHQIELTVTALEYFHRLAFVPGVGVGLALLKPYAAIKGASVIYHFLRDGYEACRTISEINPFAEAIWERELVRLNRIYRKNGSTLARSARTARRTAR